MDRQIRISDDDRERYNDVVKAAYAEGRITDDELEERLAAVLEARFEADLAPVVADLPNPPLLTPTPAPLPPPARRNTRPDEVDRSSGGVIGPEVTPFLMAPLIARPSTR